MWASLFTIFFLAALWVVWALIFWGKAPNVTEVAGRRLVNQARRRRPF